MLNKALPSISPRNSCFFLKITFDYFFCTAFSFRDDFKINREKDANRFPLLLPVLRECLSFLFISEKREEHFSSLGRNFLGKDIRDVMIHFVSCKEPTFI